MKEKILIQYIKIKVFLGDDIQCLKPRIGIPEDIVKTNAFYV